MTGLLLLAAAAPASANGPDPQALPPVPVAQCQGIGFEYWLFWFHHNREGLFDVDVPRPGMAKARTETLQPAFLRLLENHERTHQAIVGNTLIALAKIATTSEHVETLLRHTNPAHQAHPFAQECAILGLGLLRRDADSRWLADKELNVLREHLVTFLQDPKRTNMQRRFAAISLGLLADQPHAPDGQSASQGVERILANLQGTGQRHGMQATLLTALGLFPPVAFTAAQLEVLRRVVREGKHGAHDVTQLARAHAAVTLGRVGTEEDIALLSRMRSNRRVKNVGLRRSCALALGALGVRVEGKGRVSAAKSLLIARAKDRDVSTRAFATMALADVVAADMRAGHKEVVLQTGVRDRLVLDAASGRYLDRPYAAVALGRILRAIPENPPKLYASFRKRALAPLRKGLRSKKLSRCDHGAFALALGLARDRESTNELRTTLQNETGESTTRGFAALALGLLGEPEPQARALVRRSLGRDAPVEFRMQMAQALALWKDTKGAERIQRELPTRAVGRFGNDVMLAVSICGDASALPALTKILLGDREQDMLRAQAAAVLGVLGDPLDRPSFSRLTYGLNYRASDEVIERIFGTL